MKKILSLFFIAFITVNNVYPIEIDGINYNFDEVSLTASVVSKNPKYSGNIILPSSVVHEGKTYSVAKIESYAFEDCYYLKNVTMSMLQTQSAMLRLCAKMKRRIWPVG